MEHVPNQDSHPYDPDPDLHPYDPCQDPHQDPHPYDSDRQRCVSNKLQIALKCSINLKKII